MENTVKVFKKPPTKGKLLNLDEELIKHIQVQADKSRLSWTRYVKQALIEHTNYLPIKKEETHG